MNSVPDSALYYGKVAHKRLRPFTHHLAYRVFSVWLDIDALDQLDHTNRLFGYNRWRPLSFYDKDHGPRDGTPLRPWVESKLSEWNIDLKGGDIRLFCFPRLWGYVFNPLSIYYCYLPSGQLRAVLYEVANTFGEWHGYLLECPHDTDDITQKTEKVFHVSPFNEMGGQYKFRLKPPGERFGLLIQQSDPDGAPLLIASHIGERKTFCDKTLLAALTRYPLMSFKVVAAIHWEALKLWLKGARYVPKPPPPKQEITGPSQLTLPP